MIGLRSSNLYACEYDEDKRVLAIAFRGGGLYYYDNCPKDLYVGLLTAPSSGKYFHANIKGLPFRKAS